MSLQALAGPWPVTLLEVTGHSLLRVRTLLLGILSYFHLQPALSPH